MSALTPVSLPFRELAAESLRFGYADKPVIDGVTFRAGPGELVAIVGPNGCGKSTLLNLLLGALKPGVGRVLLDGKALGEWGRIGVARRMALVPQMGGGGGEAADLAGTGFTVEQTVLMARYAAHVDEARGVLKVAGGMGIFGFETAADQQLAREAMWGADVHHLVERQVETLSGGERQRVAIARAMAQQTPILLLDEPTSALDLYHQLELMEQLRGLTRAGASGGGSANASATASAGRLVLLVTHDLNLARAAATRVIVMDQGRIAADGMPGDVLTPAILEPVYQVRVMAGETGLRFERQ